MGAEPKDRLKASIKGDTARRERLAAELRANLKRRKAQARAVERSGAEGAPAPAKADDQA